MTVIQNATGNNFSEILTNVINQVSTQFSEGINGAVNGFRQFSQNGVQGFANNGQQTSHRTVSGISTSESFKDNQHAEMLASERRMQAQEVDFFGGPEDARAVSQVKQAGAQ